MSEWISLPTASLLEAASEPYLVRHVVLPDLLAYVRAAGAASVEIDARSAMTQTGAIDLMKAVLPFPAWCGSSWDSIDDAFSELHTAWPFPLVMLVHGLPELLSRKPHAALELVIRLSQFAHSFADTGDQFLVVYSADTWI